MFYILEISNRLKYFFFSFCFLFSISYNYYNVFFTFLDFLFKKILNEKNDSLLNYYIYTHPFELYYTHLFFCFILSLHIIIPYFIWQLLDFNKTSFYKYQYYQIYKFFLNSLFIFFFSYIFLYGYIVPYFLEILQYAKQTYISNFFSVFFELKVQDFISFILYLNTIFTILISFLILLNIFIFNITLYNIITTKKIIYLIAIIFSTFISPPDIISQILLLFIILSTIEIILFIRIFQYYLKK